MDGLPCSSAVFVRTGTMLEQALTILHFSVLKEHLHAAAVAFIQVTTPAYRAKDITESLLFVHGTGLDVLVQSLDDRVDPDTFRETYFAWCARQKKSRQPLPSSSRIIPAVS